MIELHNLQGNEWLKKIYEKQEKWEPQYVRNVFCAGKRTTQLSECFNSTLRRFLKLGLNMNRFLRHFQRAVDDLRYNELQLDFKMLDTVHNERSGDPLHDHAAEVYTPTMLRAYMEQSREAGYVVPNCRLGITGTEDIEVHVCSRGQDHNCSTSRRYVIHEENGVYHCSCKYFNVLGIICSHIIFVMRAKCLFAIPDAYILSRWRKDARRTVAPINRSHSTDDPTILKVVNRRIYVNQFASLCHRHGAKNKSWPIFDCYYQELEKELDHLSDEGDPDAPTSDGFGVGVDIPIIAKGFKSRPPKHQGNKRGPSRGRGGGRASSQPTARHLQLLDEGEDESITGRFRSLDEL